MLYHTKMEKNMYTEKYRMADKVIEVTSIYEEVHKYCADYKCAGEPDIKVVITQEDIAFERGKSDSEAEGEGRIKGNSSDAYLEELAVYRKIAEKMPDFDTILFHGSAIAVDGQGYLFTARSGTGKSTHTRLWRELLGDKAVMVNDDKPLISMRGDGVTVYGTPYNGKHKLGCDMSVPLKALCILTRAEQNYIERISRKKAYTMLLQQTYRPGDPVQMAKTLALVDKLADRTELYLLGCNMDISAAETAYNGMKG